MGIDARMFVRTMRPLAPAAVRELSAKMCDAFGHSHFWLEREDDVHALEIVDKMWQDGPDIVPKPGEQFIRCRVWTRYYGPEYERGDFLLIAGVARWLEAHIVGGRVWYGGDSSGVEAAPFDHEAMWRHFVEYGHAPYDRAFTHRPQPACTFCGDRLMVEFGGGCGDTFWRCAGCGYEIAVNDATKDAAVMKGRPMSQRTNEAPQRVRLP